MAKVKVSSKNSSKSQKRDLIKSSDTYITYSLNTNRNNALAKTVATSADLSSAAESELIKTHALKDRGKVVAMAYFMLGIAFIMPWTMFSTATTFYTDFKLSLLSPSFKNDTSALSRITEYRSFFINYLGIVVQIPNLSVCLFKSVHFVLSVNRNLTVYGFGAGQGRLDTRKCAPTTDALKK